MYYQAIEAIIGVTVSSDSISDKYQIRPLLDVIYATQYLKTTSNLLSNLGNYLLYVQKNILGAGKVSTMDTSRYI